MRWGCLLAVPLVAIGIVGTYSRSGFLALAAVAFTFVLFQRRRVVWLTGLVVLMVPIGFFMASQEGYLDRMATIQSYEDEASAASRPHFWRVAVAMAVDRPTGIGLFNYESAYDQYDFLTGKYGVHRSVHSSHFQVLAENGFLGAIVDLPVVLRADIDLPHPTRIRGRRPEDRQTYLAARARCGSMMAFLVGVRSSRYRSTAWLTFAMVAALIGSRVARARPRRRRRPGSPRSSRD